MEAMTLYELNRMVRGALENVLHDEYWLQAELSEVREGANGHCYLEFVEKDQRGRDLIAKARGTIWANIYRLVKPMFERETGRSFAAGMKVLVKVSVSFHELYGYSLTVTDIDPAYTLGDMARQRKEILDRLSADGILNDNKELVLPVLAKHVAVISAPGAAGYGDFCDQLLHNDYGLAFHVRLFPAVMQGERVESTILAALDAIMNDSVRWDVVVIIRGGGATSDLSGFDTYLLAAACAQFPLPIITGIGHERDDTVLDAVAHTRVKTPTAAAAFLINHQMEVVTRLNGWQVQLADLCNRMLHDERLRQERCFLRLTVVQKEWKVQGEYQLQLLRQRLVHALNGRIGEEKHRMSMLQQACTAADPAQLLYRGYSMTFCNGVLVRDATTLKSGDELVTRWAEGETHSVVK